MIRPPTVPSSDGVRASVNPRWRPTVPACQTPSPSPRYLQWVALVLVSATTGCLVLPTPAFHSGSARENLHRRSLEPLQTNQSTRADVILTLGEPDAVSPDEHQLVYRMERIRALWFVGAGYTGIGGVFTRDEYRTFTFNAAGILQTIDQQCHWVTSTDPDKLTSSLAAPMESDHPHLELPADWIHGVDARTAKASQSPPPERGRLLLGATFAGFRSKRQLANEPPVWSVPYDTLADAETHPPRRPRLLVLRRLDGAYDSFVLLRPGRTPLERAARFKALQILQERLHRPAPASEAPSHPP